MCLVTEHCLLTNAPATALLQFVLVLKLCLNRHADQQISKTCKVNNHLTHS